MSQSGGSPDLVEVVRVAREQGALTLAVTNAPSSALALIEFADVFGSSPIANSMTRV